MKLPQIPKFPFSDMLFIHLKVSPYISSLSPEVFIEKPVLNISGSMTMSVLSNKGFKSSERFWKLRDLSSQIIIGCITEIFMEQRYVVNIVKFFRDPCRCAAVPLERHSRQLKEYNKTWREFSTNSM